MAEAETPRFKTKTYRVHFLTPSTPDSADGTVHNRTWEEIVDDVLDAGGQFITVRFVGGFDEVTVRERIG